MSHEASDTTVDPGQPPDIDNRVAHHHADAASGMPAATGNAMANEAAAVRHRQKAFERSLWSEKPLKAAFRLVALPSLLTAGASLLLCHANNKVNGGLNGTDLLESNNISALQTAFSFAAGVAYYPLHRFVVEPVANVLGRLSGNVANFKNQNLMFQQYTRPLKYTGAASAALAILLSHAAMTGPTYVEAATEVGEAVAVPVKAIAKRVGYGFRHYEPAAPREDSPVAKP